MIECTKCEKEKSKSAFKIDKKKSNGLSSWCKECTTISNRKYGKKHRKDNLRDSRLKVLNWEKINPEKKRESRKEQYQKAKLEVYNHYCLGNIKCQCCGESEYKFLCIDHINNDGAKDRKDNETHASGYAFYLRLKNSGYPTNIQILCYNCNMAKGIHGKCPHIKETNNI